MRPVNYRNKPGIRIDELLAGAVEKGDGLRVETIDGEGGERSRLFETEFLRANLGAGRGDKCREPQKQGGRRLRDLHHNVFQLIAPVAPDITGVDALRCLVLTSVRITRRRRRLKSGIPPVLTVIVLSRRRPRIPRSRQIAAV